MGIFNEAGLAVLAVVVAVVAVLVAIALRRRWLTRRGAVVQCALRSAGSVSWQSGIVAFDGDVLRWHRTLGARLRPDRRFRRRDLAVRRRRDPVLGESGSVPAGAQVIECDAPGGPVEFALPYESVPALLAWLESSPPSHHLRHSR